MRAVDRTILGVLRGWWFKSVVIKVPVEEWREIKLENSRGIAQNLDQNDLKHLLKYAQ